MEVPKTDDKTLISALRILAHDIQSSDDIPMLCILEGADRLQELIDESEQKEKANEWQLIETAPKSEVNSFLVYVYEPDNNQYVVVQVSNFQGDMYPDALGVNIDTNDRITNATHWKPLPALPKELNE